MHNIKRRWYKQPDLTLSQELQRNEYNNDNKQHQKTSDRLRAHGDSDLPLSDHIELMKQQLKERKKPWPH